MQRGNKGDREENEDELGKLGKIKTREILADDAILYATHWQPRQT